MSTPIPAANLADARIQADDANARAAAGDTTISEQEALKIQDVAQMLKDNCGINPLVELLNMATSPRSALTG